MFASGFENLAKRCDGSLQLGHVIAQRLTKTTGLQEIPLHIDNHERGAVDVNGKRRRLGIKSYFRHLGPPCNRIGEGYALTVQD
jgi:hypothetical protein